MARTLDVHISTIYREIERGEVNGRYNAEKRQVEYETRLKEKGRPPTIKENSALQEYISKKILVEKMSPEQISRELKQGESGFAPVSHNTIYTAIDRGYIPGVTRDSLKSETVKMFSGGHIIIPARIIRENKFQDGDYFKIEVCDDGCVRLRKQKEIM